MKVKKLFALPTAFLSTLIAVPIMNTNAAPPPSNNPQIYIDFTVDNGRMRGDVVFNNVPEVASAGFNIELGDGLKFVPYSGSRYISNCHENFNGMYYFNIIDDQNVAFVYASAAQEDLNGTFFSFYVEPTNVSVPSNSTGNVIFQGLGYLGNDHGSFYSASGSSSIIIETPVILESGEFIYGDADDNTVVDGSDVTRIMAAINEYGNDIPLSSFTENTLTKLPTYTTAFASDVNNDGYIDSTDYTAVLQYYGLMLAGSPYTGNIGTVDIYEIY